MAFARALNAGRVPQLPSPPGPDFGVMQRRDPSPETRPRKCLKSCRETETVERAPRIAQGVAPPPRPVSKQRFCQAEGRNVKKGGQKQYDTHLQAFRVWCRGHYGRSLEADGPTQVMRLLDYLDGMMANRFPVGDAEKVVAAFRFANPGLAPPRLRLGLRLTRALGGYRKAMPPRSRMGITEEVMAGLANYFANEGHLDAAVETVTRYYCYLRPGESRKLQVSHLGCPVGGRNPGLNYHTLTVAPQEELDPAKTQVFDDTIVLDNPCWLGPLLAARSRGRPPHALLFTTNPVVLGRIWKQGIARLKLPRTVQYQLRHGGQPTTRWLGSGRRWR